MVEDRFCAGRPALEQVGVQFTDDVAAYEQVKLRMLNATHTMLSYPGLLAGYQFVYEATADPSIHAYLRAFLDRDVIPTLTAPPGLSPADYRDTVLARFANPAVKDQLLRITSDGASKIPVFLGETLRRLPRPQAATTGGSPSCSPPSPTIWAAATTGARRSRRCEPHLAPRRPGAGGRRRSRGRAADRQLQGSGAGAARAASPPACATTARRIAADGALATLAAMQAEGG